MSCWRRTTILRPTLALAAAAFVAAPCAGIAQTPLDAPVPTSSATADASAKGGGFAIRRQVIAGGGGTSSGGAFVIAGTVGQTDADPLHPASGGVFAISGGFWPGLAAAAPAGDAVFANGFEPTTP